MDFGAIIRKAKKAAADNAPTILTAIGVTGTITTAVLVGQASFKASKVIAERHHELVDDQFEPLPAAEQTKILFPHVWKYYVPAVVTGAVTVSAIISANHISTRRAAAIASAYSLSQEAFKEYKSKVVEKIGVTKEQKIRDDIAKDRFNENPPATVIAIGNGDVLCRDGYSGRDFMSTLEKIKKAENDTNYQIIHGDYASLSEFWDRLGLPKTSESDEVGWSSDSKLEIEYGHTLTEDGRPALLVTFRTNPIRGYWSAY